VETPKGEQDPELAIKARMIVFEDLRDIFKFSSCKPKEGISIGLSG